jgi:hypothetical protein
MRVVELARKRPHLYQLMFATTKGDPAAGARAASRAQEEFLSIVGAVVGDADARSYGALLFSSAHGIAELEISGHLTESRWITVEDLFATLVAMISHHHSARPTT